MYSRKAVGIACLTLILLLTSTGIGFAQDAQPPTPPDAPLEPPFPPGKFPFGGEQSGWENQIPLQAASDVSSQAFTLGAAGLSFSYAQTFGTVETPYIADTDHLNFPWGIATDGNNILIGEYWGNRVLKYANDGTHISTIGTAGTSYNDGEFGGAFDMAVDAGGNTWVVSNDWQQVYKFDSSNAYLGLFNEDMFDRPAGIAFDGAGNVYISDGATFWNDDIGNHRVLIFDSAGTLLSTIGTTGETGTDTNHFFGPQHIAVYGTMLYVADAGNNRVQIFNISNPAAPYYSATIGNFMGESGWDEFHFDHPIGVAVDVNYIYVADRWNNRVQVFNQSTRAYVATIGNGLGTGNDQFQDPTDVAVDSAGNIYVADFVNNRVQQFNSSFIYQRTYGETGVPYLTADGYYNSPSDVTIASDGSMYITENDGHRLIKLNANGTTAWTVGSAGVKGDWDNGNYSLDNPADIAISAAGKIYVADRWHSRIQVYNPDGTYSATIGGGTGNFEFSCPSGLAIAKNGYIYVTDCWRHRVQIFNASHGYVGTLGVTDISGSDNSHFSDPEGVAVDSNGFIYVADNGNHRIQVFNASRAYVRTMGVTGETKWDFSGFSYPTKLAVDSSNRLYVADTDNNRIQVFDANGAYLTTVGGSWGSNTGRLRNPQGLGIDQNGSLYVADSGNHRIQKFTVGTPNWAQANLNGFGDRSNRVSSLYSFNGQLYAGTYNYGGNGSQLWRSSDGKNWSNIMSNGFGDATNVGIDHLLEFNGNLYAGIWNSTNTGTNGGQIWRSATGNSGDWTQVVSDGFGDPTINGEIMRMAVFNNQIYAATWSYSETDGSEIWRSSTGNSGDWTKVLDNGIGDITDRAVITMETFNGYLYAGTYSWDYIVNPPNGSPSGCEVWRTADGMTWTPITTDGFGDLNCYELNSLAVFGDSLYASTGTWDPITKNSTGGQVWSCTAASGCDAAADWTQVISDGFGKSQNDSITSLRVFGNRLYAAANNYPTGLEVWQTDNGTNWQQAGFAGFGDSNNSYTYYDTSIAIFNNRLFIGTTNWANGGEIWNSTFNLPGAFNKAGPLNGASNQPPSPTLNWGASRDIDHYEYCYGTTLNTCATGWISAGVNRSVTLRGLLPSTTYYWHARARNDFADTYANDNIWSSFTTALPVTLPLYSSPTDGWTLEAKEISNFASTLSASGKLRAGDDAQNRQYRSLLFFNTSGIPDHAIISKATLKVYKSGAIGADPINTHGDLIADIKSGFFGDSSLLQLMDFNAAAEPLSLGKFTGTSGWMQLTLSSLNFKTINVFGATQFRIRFVLDDNNNKIANIALFDSGGDANPPQLIVEYTLP